LTRAYTQTLTSPTDTLSYVIGYSPLFSCV
jgi:hypothetical protein